MLTGQLEQLRLRAQMDATAGDLSFGDDTMHGLELQDQVSVKTRGIKQVNTG